MGRTGFKYYCPECSTVRYEDSRTVCARCQDENIRVRKLYLRIMLERPHLQGLGMVGVFERMYARLLQVEQAQGMGEGRRS